MGWGDLLETNHQGNASVFHGRCLFIGGLEKCGRFPKDRQEVVRFWVLEKKKERCSYRCFVNGFIICIYFSRSLSIFPFRPWGNNQKNSSNDYNMQAITLSFVNLQIKFPSLSAVRVGYQTVFEVQKIKYCCLCLHIYCTHMRTTVQKRRIGNIFGSQRMHLFDQKISQKQ